MNKDAHYYAILAFCRACGFNKRSAHVIAYASQLVDDATINLIFYKNSKLNFEHDLVANRPAFFNMATCHSYFRIKTFNYEAMVNNTCAFHFVPGCQGENFTKKLRCKEESSVILDILKDVLLENDLVKLGIVLHAYADTFSHQGFSGMLSKVNDIKNCEVKVDLELGLLERLFKVFKAVSQDKFEKYFDRIMPAYGHVQALEYPDLPYMVWAYDYDFSDEFNGTYKRVEIDNNERYKKAFTNIKKYLEKYLKKHNQYLDETIKFNNFDLLFETLISKDNKKFKEKKWKRLLLDQKFFDKKDQDFIEYEKDKWLKEAFTNYNRKVFNHRKVDGAQVADNFLYTHWYRFFLAVRWYKKKFYEYSSKNQLTIPS